MKITAELLNSAPVRFNPLDERELCLRGLGIAVIENLSSTRNQFDCIDLTDNQIRRLEQFPRLRRLRTLLMAGNFVSRISPRLGEFLTGLDTLVLAGNRVSALAEVDSLSSCGSLTCLSLEGNEVTKRPHYRPYVLHRLPGLRVLDGTLVTKADRAEAEAFFRSAEGMALLVAVRTAREALRAAAPATRGGGEAEAGAAAASSAEDEASAAAVAGGLSDREKRAVALLVEAATSAAEVSAIERALKAGSLPAEMLARADELEAGAAAAGGKAAEAAE